jgi:hypothetical protein
MERERASSGAGRREGLHELVPIAHKWGFWWGGHFTTPDGMHFEVAVVK